MSLVGHDFIECLSIKRSIIKFGSLNPWKFWTIERGSNISYILLRIHPSWRTLWGQGMNDWWPP